MSARIPAKNHKTGPSEAWIRDHTFLLANERILKSKDQGNIALVGSISSGKTTLIEAYLESVLGYIPDSFTTVNAIVGDPKNDLLPLLRQMNLPLKVISGHVLHPNGRAWRMCDDLQNPVEAEQAVKDMLPDERTGSEKEFFAESPRLIFAAVIAELVRSGRPWTLRQAYLLAMDEFYARQIIEKSTDAKTKNTIGLFDDAQGSTKANIHASLLVKLGNIATYAAMMENCKATYSIKDLVRGEQVFVLGSDFRYSHILGPMNNLILNAMKRELLSQPNSRTRRHYVIIDEFPKLNYHNPAEEFSDFIEVGRSRGVRTALAMQSTRQLVPLYGEDGASIIIGNCQNKVILRVADYAGATDCSNYLGRTHGYEWIHNVTEGTSETTSRDGKSTTRNFNRGASEVFAERPLVYPDELMDLPLASRTKGFSGYAASPALPRTKRWGFFISPAWIREHIRDQDLTFSIDESDDVKSFSDPLPRDLHLRELDLDEVKAFGLVFKPNGHRP